MLLASSETSNTIHISLAGLSEVRENVEASRVDTRFFKDSLFDAINTVNNVARISFK
jgi:hypothetical protein